MADHAGYMYGYHAYTTVFPELQFAIMSCANGLRNDGFSVLHDTITELLFRKYQEYRGITIHIQDSATVYEFST